LDAGGRTDQPGEQEHHVRPSRFSLAYEHFYDRLLIADRWFIGGYSPATGA
jgi:hypothetical protein